MDVGGQELGWVHYYDGCVGGFYGMFWSSILFWFNRVDDFHLEKKEVCFEMSGIFTRVVFVKISRSHDWVKTRQDHLRDPKDSSFKR